MGWEEEMSLFSPYLLLAWLLEVQVQGKASVYHKKVGGNFNQRKLPLPGIHGSKAEKPFTRQLIDMLHFPKKSSFY